MGGWVFDDQVRTLLKHVSDGLPLSDAVREAGMTRSRAMRLLADPGFREILYLFDRWPSEMAA